MTHMAAADLSSNLCHNVGIQKGIFKVGYLDNFSNNPHLIIFLPDQAVEVRQSLWGLGLFISEPCEAGDLISGKYA